MIRVAINGFGRIGRTAMRILCQSTTSDFQIVAINTRRKSQPDQEQWIKELCHRFKYDSIFGTFQGSIRPTSSGAQIGSHQVIFCSHGDPADCPWSELDIDLVLECSGQFCSKQLASGHLTAGAKKVLISAPAKQVDATIVYGVNHQDLKADDRVVSSASCTTNALAPIVQTLDQNFGIEQGLLTTVHAYTNDQNLVDGQHRDWRRARAAALSMIPTKTGAAAAIEAILPSLAGKLNGQAVRVPTCNVSLIDLTVNLAQSPSLQELVDCFLQAASQPHAVLAVTDEPLVSVDFNQSCASCVIDLQQLQKVNNLYKVLAWYDNEWGFTQRLLDTAKVMMS
ncbi:type I glyceraldehyde-3-phosphate dehydrogenase [Gammaproteobacteria bacterium]|nr:type I glyceraldehyde-3-phosphate dehydrogenase [Gammaproteobacteria bacterium]